MKALSFGEILWDVYAHSKYIGGAPLNFAAHLARHGDEVYMASAVGSDELGELALRQLRAWNVLSRFVSVCEQKPTGTCTVNLDAGGIPSYTLAEDTAFDSITCPDCTDGFDLLYFGTLALRNKNNLDSLKGLLNRCGFNTILADVNLRAPFYTQQVVAFTAQTARIIKISLEELPQTARLLGINFTEPSAFSKALASKFANLSLIIISLGEQGAYAFDCVKNREYISKAVTVPVCSTVGAGDSFCAAFIHRYFADADIQSSLDYAVRLAGFVVSEQAAVPDYPDGLIRL